ncbi:SDR family oxidoreductase [Actinacidiphila sp. DG2A-62]|uniref:SDR family oxidoreductase n=1 Tax=Actinacidiphila sp. DG2A-62 TaxID=3108821 RepID=UPI002DB9DF06|nr:SDR family oxidoreductase [Actinacidiphila sp. DG2A-62]MEC3997362.1 SDR family oxidoreductase [Actinacidiphila sp. DG2A-62]
MSETLPDGSGAPDGSGVPDGSRGSDGSRGPGPRPRVHLLTGGGSGIGAALARRLLDRGDELWLLARDAGRARELAARHPGVRTLVGDLGEPARLSWALGHQAPPDRLDSLLHIAGTVELGRVGDLTPKIWNETLAVNLVGPAELTRLLLPQLRLSRGHVVFANSGAGLTAHAEWSAYAASKHGLRALADSLRGEEHANGVRVTTVYPGRTATPMQAKVHQQEGKQYDAARWIDPESVATAVLTAIDLPRDAEVTDLSVRPGA